MESTGKDPFRLVFEDELTGIYNRRFLLRYLDSRIPWDSLEKRTVSLVMMDVDYFKSVNDTYGHMVGDRALIWFAEHLKAASKKDGLPIRYAGDEFILLLETSDKPLAVSSAKKLLDRLHADPFPIPEAETAIDLTASLGVATVPADAGDWKGFIQKADLALYLAKKRGRDQVVDAAEVGAEEAPEKVAFNQLGAVKMVGRRDQSNTVNAALKQFQQGSNGFVLVKGAAGMGKTAFLEAVRKSLLRSKILHASARGVPQEVYRPYYVVEQLLVDLLNQLPDKGMSLLDGLGQPALGLLSLVMPGLVGDATGPEPLDEAQRRKGIFETLARIFSAIAKKRPLFWFIDDIFFGDEATLLLIRRLNLQSKLKLFVIATTSEDAEMAEEEGSRPLDRFVARYGEELDLVWIPLTPLKQGDIYQQIRGLFPGIALQKEFCDELARISRGNPLFLSEILKKMVLDRQITLVGHNWTLRPLQNGYLPHSLEEMVSEKIAGLDESSRLLLDRISAMGEYVPVSTLVGSSSLMEAKVLEFIDQAAAHGLLASDFALNEENVRFFSKQIMDITYNAIEPERRKQLHGQIGTYQEELFKQHRVPAATLAYHFKRSDDDGKAKRYERIQSEASLLAFDAGEAAGYSGRMPSPEPPAETPLSSAGLVQVPQLVRCFTVALRNIKLYPPGSKSVVRVNQDLKDTLDHILKDNGCLSISQVNRTLLVNGQRMDTSDFKMVADSLIQILDRFELKSIAFHQGLTEQEIEALTEEMGRSEQKLFDETHWETFSQTHGLNHIDLKQMRYRMQPTAGSGPAAYAKGGGKAAPRLEAETLEQIPDVVRAVLGAARTIKLYPITSNASKNAVHTLSESLRRLLSRYSLLSLSHVGSSLLINGEKIDISGFKALADGFIKYLSVIGLKSLTFLDSYTDDELNALIVAFGEVPAAGADGKFWKRVAEQQQMTGILFDQHAFEVRVKQSAAAGVRPEAAKPAPGAGAAAPPEPEPKRQTPETAAPEMPMETLLDYFETMAPDLFLKGDLDRLQWLLSKIFEQFPGCPTEMRQRTLQTLASTLQELPPADQHDLARIAAAPLASVFMKETDSKIISESAALMHRLTAVLIQFAQYAPAAHVLTALRKRRKALLASGSAVAQVLAKSFDGLMNPSTQKLVVEDFLSGNGEKQRNAVRLLAGFGESALPMLVDIVKTVDDYRSRHVAASLLANLQSAADDRIRSTLALVDSPEEKIRLLEVLDLIKADVREEVLRLLSDPDDGVRRAALQLLQRIKDPSWAKVLLELAGGPKDDVAVDAITCLGRIKTPGAGRDLLTVLNAAKGEKRLMACCLALGQIGDPDCLTPLADIVRHKGSFFRRRRYSADVKAAAAYAIGQIRHPQSDEIMAEFMNHPEPRINQIAAIASQGAVPPPS